jgi:hypothetical protein
MNLLVYIYIIYTLFYIIIIVVKSTFRRNVYVYVGEVNMFLTYIYIYYYIITFNRYNYKCI